MRVCLVAAPLIARSGVYNSATELAKAARSRGLDWSALLGVAPAAQGERASDSDAVREFAARPFGLKGVRSLRDHFMRSAQVRDADLIISMTPQTDMALATTRLRWIAYIRGLPWPAPGEANVLRALAWRGLERLALTRALETWATTPILAEEAGVAGCRLVPPGIMPPAESSKPSTGASEFVWAARFSEDKNPRLFLNVMAKTKARGTMFGTGPLEPGLRQSAPDNVLIGGWRNKADLWRQATAYVGTSFREAFGRSAVEAAMLGIPLIVSDRFGCASMLYTDPGLKQRFVLPVTAPDLWVRAITDLQEDAALRRSVAAHVLGNAQVLSIEAAVSNVEKAVAEVYQNGTCQPE